LIVMASVTAVMNAAVAVADARRAPFVVANSAAVAVPPSWLPVLAVLKGAGAIGLVVGLTVFGPIGVAAAAGLVLFFVGAVIAHVRARVFGNIAVPVAFLACATATLVLSIVP
jgi:hypothetical protein